LAVSSELDVFESAGTRSQLGATINSRGANLTWVPFHIILPSSQGFSLWSLWTKNHGLAVAKANASLEARLPVR
jgi:hypothetical protein